MDAVLPRRFARLVQGLIRNKSILRGSGTTTAEDGQSQTLASDEDKGEGWGFKGETPEVCSGMGI